MSSVNISSKYECILNFFYLISNFIVLYKMINTGNYVSILKLQFIWNRIGSLLKKIQGLTLINYYNLSIVMHNLVGFN